MPRNIRSLATAMAVTVAGLAMSAGTASANFFEFSSSISLGATSGIASVSSTSISSPGTIILTTTNESVITLTANQRSTAANHLNGNPNPVFGSNANFGSVGALPSATTVDTISVAFSYTVTLTDFTAQDSLASNGTGSVVFSGLITGSIGGGGVGLQIQNFTPTPNIGGPPSPAGIVFIPGVVNYLAQPYSATPPDGIVNGVLSSTFTVTAIPEPTSITLTGLGGVGLIGLYRRKMKRAA